MNKNIISLELLKEIIKYRYATIKSCKLSGKFIITTAYETNTKGKHNIYELAHKCKEWALTQGFFLESGLPSTNRATAAIFSCSSSGFIEGFESNSEQEAIFEACQWILENKGKK